MMSRNIFSKPNCHATQATWAHTRAKHTIFVNKEKLQMLSENQSIITKAANSKWGQNLHEVQLIFYIFL